MKIDTKKLYLAMANSQYTIDDLASKSKINKYTILKLSKGEVRPHARTAGKIAKALGVDVQDILED